MFLPCHNNDGVSPGQSIASVPSWCTSRRCWWLLVDEGAIPSLQPSGQDRMQAPAPSSMTWTMFNPGNMPIYGTLRELGWLLITRDCRGCVGKDGERVEISDMTWEHKEQVLRLLFSKMNSAVPHTTTSDHCPPLPPLSSPSSIQPVPLPSPSSLPPLAATHAQTHPPTSHTHSLAFLTQSGGQGAGQTLRSMLAPPLSLIT